MERGLIVAGIGTEVGKTVASAVLVKMLGWDYWKPISCGPEEERDSLQVRRLVADTGICCHGEAYHFATPASPHQAAALEGMVPEAAAIGLPAGTSPLVIESVGGVMVPLNDRQLTLDVFVDWKLPWVVVAKNYLGSINHTLLTVAVLKQKGCRLLGLIFNGPRNDYSEEFILNYTGLQRLSRIAEEHTIDSETITRYSKLWETEPFWSQFLASRKTGPLSGTPIRRQ